MATTSTLDALNDTIPASADPARFRIKYRQQRWYVDPLDTCDVAPATKERWPALSTLKRAWNSTFRKTWAANGTTYDLDPLRVALYADDNWDALTPLSRAERVPRLTLAAKADLTAAADRGTAVHNALDLLLGGDERGAAETCHPDYWATIRRMVADLEIDLVHAERVAISRTHGWGGTFDGIATIDGRDWLIDWKTRGADSRHGAYEAEAAQLGGYGLSDYIVIEGNDGNAQRVPLPQLAGGLVISIKPDSWEIYPVDLTAAGAACQELHAAWETIATGKRHGRRAIGEPWGKTEPTPGHIDPPAQPVPGDRSEWITQRIDTLVLSTAAKAMLADTWPKGLPKRGPWGDDQVDTIATLLEPIETAVEAPFPHRDPNVVATEKARHNDEIAALLASAPRPLDRPTPDDGPTVDPGDVDALKRKASQLDPIRARLCQQWRSEGKHHGAPWGGTVDGGWSLRCWAGNRAAIACAAHLYDDDTGQTYVRSALALVIGEELQPAWPTGAVMGTLTADEADHLADIALRAATGEKEIWTALASHASAV